MPDPIELRIIQNLQTVLRAITVANGYFHDVSALALKLDADATVADFVGTLGLRPLIILEVLPEALTYFPAEQVRLVMPFAIHFVNETDATDDAAMLEEYYKLAADIEQAIAADGTRGALATDTVITGREKRGGYEGRQVWAVITCAVKQTRTYGNPNG